MDVTKKRKPEAEDRRPNGGFTLIESMVAMGLFVGVVFLLIFVFGDFLMDDFCTKTNKAFVIAENDLYETGQSKTFESVQRDTLGFHLIRVVTIDKNVAFVDVSVEGPAKDTAMAISAPLVSKKAATGYIRLSKVFPVP